MNQSPGHRKCSRATCVSALELPAILLLLITVEISPPGVWCRGPPVTLLFNTVILLHIFTYNSASGNMPGCTGSNFWDTWECLCDIQGAYEGEWSTASEWSLSSSWGNEQLWPCMLDGDYSLKQAQEQSQGRGTSWVDAGASDDYAEGCTPLWDTEQMFEKLQVKLK